MTSASSRSAARSSTDLLGVTGTDTYVAMGLAEDAATRAGTLVAPPVWYGESSHHMALAGDDCYPRGDPARADEGRLP
jgi:hypothetical protein